MKNGERYCWAFSEDKLDDAIEFAKQKRIELFGKE
jgi:hypothetical protein